MQIFITLLVYYICWNFIKLVMLDYNLIFSKFKIMNYLIWQVVKSGSVGNLFHLKVMLLGVLDLTR